MTMKNCILLLLLLLAATLFVALQKYTKKHYSSFEQTEISSTELPAPRYLAADFTLSDLNGNSTRLSDFRGSVVLLMFWTSW